MPKLTDKAFVTFNFEPRIELPLSHGLLARFAASEIRCFVYGLFGRPCPTCAGDREP